MDPFKIVIMCVFVCAREHTHVHTSARVRVMWGHMCDGHWTAPCGKFSPSTFTWVLRIKLEFPGFSAKRPYLLIHLAGWALLSCLYLNIPQSHLMALAPMALCAFSGAFVLTSVSWICHFSLMLCLCLFAVLRDCFQLCLLVFLLTISKILF